MTEDKEILENIRKREVKNILAKLNSGKTLSPDERKILARHFGGGLGKRKKLTHVNDQQRKFCQLIAGGGLTKIKCYMTAYPGVKLSSARTLVHQLEKQPLIIAEIARLKQLSENAYVLTVQAKREYLARVVRSCPKDYSRESDLVADYDEIMDDDGVVKSVRIRGLSKLEAIKIDNLMAGHNSNEKSEVAISGGVMVVPGGNMTLEQMEQEMREQQAILKQETEE
jgi:hypothetical protein